MQQPWWKQLLIGLALFLAGYFMFGGGSIGTSTKPNTDPAPASSMSPAPVDQSSSKPAN